MDNKLLKFVAAFLSLIILMSNITFATEAIESGCELTSTENTITYSQDKTEIATTIREAMENRESTFTIYYGSTPKLSEADVRSLIDELLDLSFVETNSPTQGDYLRYSFKGYNISYIDNQEENSSNYNYDITLTFNYNTTKQQEEELTTEINKLIQDFGFDENTTDREKIDTIYSYITYNVKYDYDNLTNTAYQLHHTAYAALMHQKAVCDGYALLFYRLAKECGIDSRIITGTTTSARDVEHAWNIVKLDNYYYYVDSTWDAEAIEYSYYLKGTDDFLEHTNDPQFETEDFKTKYPIPSIGLTIEQNILEENDFQYISVAGKAFITKYIGTATDVIVPNKLGDCYVIQVNRHTFYENDNIKSITFSEGIRTLSQEAISTCRELETVNYPSTMNLSASTTTGLSNNPSRCFKLKTITVAEGNEYIKVVDGILYTADMKSVLQCPAAYDKETVIIHDGIEIIGPSSFEDCVNIKKITMPDSVIVIGSWAFNGASKLEEINISEKCEYIGQYVFQHTSVKKLHIPAAAIRIEDAVFGLYSSIEEITVDSGNTEYYVENGILRNENCVIKYLSDRNETTYTVPDGIENICDYAFTGANNLTNIYLPDSLLTLNAGAFYECINLTDIILPNKVTIVEESVFWGCRRLASIIIPSSVEYIDSQTFINMDLDGFTIYSTENSIAHQYALDNNIRFKPIDEFICHNGHNFEKHYELNELVCKTYRFTCTVCGDQSSLYSEHYIELAQAEVTLEYNSTEFTGKELKPKIISIINDGEILVENVDYKIDYYDWNIDVGYGLICISGIGKYVGQVYKQFEITPADISKFNVKLEYTSTNYDGYEKYPAVTIDGLTIWEDYEVEYRNNVDFGTASVIIRGINNCTGEITKTFNINLKLSAPKSVKLYLIDKHNDVQIDWEQVDKASGYAIYYKKGNSSYNKLTTIDSPYIVSYTVKNLAEASQYTFKIYPLKKNSNGKFIEENTYKSASINTLRNLSAPSKVSLSLYGYNDVKVSWNKVSNANGYYVYYKKSSSSNYTYAGSTTGTSFNQKNLSANVKYTFKVVPYYIVGSKTYEDDSSKTATISTLKNLSAPSKVTLSLYGYDDVKVSWKKVSNAKSYNIYYKKSSSSNYTYAGNTTGTSFKQKNLGDGVKYKFKVVPCHKVNSKVYEVDSSKTATIYTLKKVKTPSVKKSSKNKVKVSWSNIDGESGYEISMSTSKNGTKVVTKYSTTTGKSKTITTKKGKKYYYKVRAYKIVDKKKIYAPWSSTKSYKLK